MTPTMLASFYEFILWIAIFGILCLAIYPALRSSVRKFLKTWDKGIRDEAAEIEASFRGDDLP